jgi:outer membrane protein assembly factor BamD (BamD/ComL family)
MKTKYINTLILFMLISMLGMAQNPKRIFNNSLFKGMEARATADIDSELDKAKENFEKVLVKEPDSRMANIGLAALYAVDKYSGKDYFKAFAYFQKAYNAKPAFTADEKEVLNLLFFKQDKRRKNRPIDKNMEWEYLHLEDKLIKFVREENNAEHAKRFLKEFPDSKYKTNVAHILTYIKFREAEKQNTVDAFNQFLNDYPKSAQVGITTKLRNNLAYQNAIGKGTLQDLRDFVSNYPEAQQVNKVRKQMADMAFTKAAATKTLEAIDKYIADFPNSSKIAAAKLLKKQLLFEWAKSVNSLEAYNQFVSLYPEGKQFVDIFNLKASILGDEILKDFPEENYLFVKGFDNQEFTDFGGGIATRPNGELVVVSATPKAEGEMYDSWILGLDANGKMLWNKMLGNPFDDMVNKISVSTQNEIYVAGITNAILDSVPGQAWIYKLSANGQNLFNQKVSLAEALDFVVYPDNQILIAGYTQNTQDSLFTPALVKLNADGKKLWSRNYTNKGKVHALTSDTASNTAFAAAGNWIFAINEAGYLQWDILLPENQQATAVGMNAKKQVLFAGSTDNAAFAAAYDSSGKKLWDSPLKLTGDGMPEHIVALADNSFVIAATYDKKIKLVQIDDSGSVKSEKEFSLPQGVKLNDITLTDGNAVAISASRLGDKADLIVFKLGF